MTLTLKIATYDHFPEILEMFERFHGSSNYKNCEFDQSKMSDVVINAIEDKSSQCLVVLVDESNSAKGVLFGSISEQIFNRERTAFEIVWWVNPEYRNTRASIRLFKAFEYWAKKTNCTNIVTGAAEETKETAGVKRFYAKHGYSPVECNFIKRI
jgi:hypothetical protein